MVVLNRVWYVLLKSLHLKPSSQPYINYSRRISQSFYEESQLTATFIDMEKACNQSLVWKDIINIKEHNLSYPIGSYMTDALISCIIERTFCVKMNTFSENHFTIPQGSAYILSSFQLISAISQEILEFSFLCMWPVSYTHLDVYKRQLPVPSRTLSNSG